MILKRIEMKLRIFILIISKNYVIMMVNNIVRKDRLVDRLLIRDGVNIRENMFRYRIKIKDVELIKLDF